MLRAVRKRSSLIRVYALLWATFQIAAPGAIAVADGLAARSSSTPFAHVESGSTSRCPEVHGLDCAMCRYLSNPIAALAGPARSFEFSVAIGSPLLDAVDRVANELALPRGRAPPLG
jgi:hypothetical protein